MSREFLWEALKGAGVPDQFISVTRMIYYNNWLIQGLFNAYSGLIQIYSGLIHAYSGLIQAYSGLIQSYSGLFWLN